MSKDHGEAPCDTRVIGRAGEGTMLGITFIVHSDCVCAVLDGRAMVLGQCSFQGGAVLSSLHIQLC